MSVQAVAVLGAGTMGQGIAHVSAAAGCAVALYDVSAEAAARGLAFIRANLEAGVQRGKVTPADRDAALARVRTVSDLRDAVAGADLVVEAVPEKLALKQELFARVEPWVGEETILGTNTSSLSVAAIASAVAQPGRVIGLHFFNPVHIMKLLEIIVADATSPDVLERSRAFGVRIGKQCITVRDVPGFATSRLGVCLGMEAIRMVEQGVASAEDIDAAMVLGYRHPVGPLKLTDMVGLDVRMHIGEYLARELGNAAFEPPALMRSMVADGRLGKKTGRGFYDWE
jgi:3-hydroxybutyryl-CoA dehydrogenase